MTKIGNYLMAGLLAAVVLSACREENEPVSLTPALFVNEVEMLTGTTAFLSGSYDPMGQEVVTTVVFHYGTTEAMENTITGKLSGRTATVLLEGLAAGTTYYYCLEIGNGADSRRSEVRQFTTEKAPVPAYLTNENLINAVEEHLSRSFYKEDDGTVSLANDYNLRLVEMVTRLQLNDIGDPDITDEIYLFTSLRVLECAGNGIQRLNLYDNPALEELYCDGRNIKGLNEWGDEEWKGYDGTLMSLMLPTASALRSIHVRGNLLTSLDVTGCPDLVELDCMYCALRGLDVSKNPALEKLWCCDNPLGTLDLSHNPKLTYLNNGSCRLSTLDLSRNTALTSIECADNQLQRLDVSMLPELYYLQCGGNPMTSIDLSNNTKLEKLSIYNSHIPAIDLSNLTLLTEIDFNVHEFTSLDLSNLPGLERLLCQYGPLTELDLSHNPKLNILECHGNYLTVLDVSQNPNLGWLTCYENQMTELDVSMIDDNISLMVGAQHTRSEVPLSLTLYVNEVQYAHEPGTFVYYMDKYNEGHQDRVTVVLKQ